MLEVERQPQKADRLGLEKVFSILVNDYGEQFLPIFVKLLDNKDKQVRFVAIENLGRFKRPETSLDHANCLYEVLEKRIVYCKQEGRFKELYELIELWEQLTGSLHELAPLAKEIFTLVTNNGIEDEETATYVGLVKTVAEENRLRISFQQLHLSLSSDDNSKWIAYQIILPEAELGETVFKMNLRLVEITKNMQLSKQVRQIMVVMFR